jgi:hypothetical protein
VAVIELAYRNIKVGIRLDLLSREAVKKRAVSSFKSTEYTDVKQALR